MSDGDCTAPHCFFLMKRRPPISTLFPYTTLFRSTRAPPRVRGAWHAGPDQLQPGPRAVGAAGLRLAAARGELVRSEEHTSELQSQSNLVCRLLLEKKHHIRYLSN